MLIKKVKYTFYLTIFCIGICFLTTGYAVSSTGRLSLKLVGSLKLTERAITRLTLSDRYAYLAACKIGYDVCQLNIIDLENPANPVFLGSLGLGRISKIVIAGNYAYIAEYLSDGIKIVDIANPQRPVLVGNIKTGGCANEFAVIGNYAYVIDGINAVILDSKKGGRLLKLKHGKGGGLKIFDIKNPITPRLIGKLNLCGELRELTIVENYAYVVDAGSIDGVWRRTDGVYKDAGFKIINVANPKTPVLVGSLPAYRVYDRPIVVGNYAYIVLTDTPSRGKSELKVIKITNPARPVAVGSLVINGYLNKLIADGKKIYMSYSTKREGPNMENGIKIISITNSEKPILVGDLKTENRVDEMVIVDNKMYIANGEAGLKIFSISPTS